MDLDAPRAVHVATRLADVVGVLAEADRAAARGQWAAVMIAYEAAAAFDPAMASAVRDYGELALPLAWVAVFDDAAVIRRPPHEPPHAAARVPPAAVVPAPWTPSLSREGFTAAVARIAAGIAAGDTYQVNYTFALEREGAGPIESGDLDAWVDALCVAHEAGYGARLDIGDFVVLSASPELFVERRGVYTRAQAARPDVDDVILWNTHGEITEATIANVVVEIGGERWTPPRTCGLLPGIARGRLVDEGNLGERRIAVAELKKATRLWLVSALRGEIEAVLVP